MSETMESRSTICVYCSVPVSIVSLLKGVRKFQPDAEITAIVPPGFVWAAEDPCPVDHLLPAAFGLAALRHPVQLYRFVGDLRRKRFDLLLTQFESIRLRIFAVLVKPKEAISWLPTFEMRPMSTCLAATLLDMARLRARGYGTMLVALVYACILPNRPKVKILRPRE